MASTSVVSKSIESTTQLEPSKNISKSALLLLSLSLLSTKMCPHGQVWVHYKCRRKVRKITQPTNLTFDMKSLIEAIQKKYQKSPE